ncbi:O-antigen ligase [Schaalia sp. JY-X169]|uniref:O-antigen ligase family protein n=1 Tax=Schaalia sp. JY-X169 TaxID=2758572 RepID=UPI0015F6101E|nr:O-antigen ligase family protein [Schaalia sp. JY-X169]
MLTNLNDSALIAVGTVLRLPTLLAGVLFALSQKTPQHRAKTDPAFVIYRSALFLFVAFGIISSIWAPDRVDTLIKSATLVLLLAFLNLMKTRRWDVDARVLRGDIGDFVFVLQVTLVVSYLLTFLGVVPFGQFQGRYSGIFWNPNTVAMLGATLIFPSAWLSRSRRWPVRVSSVAIPSAAVLLSGSRGALLAVAIGALFLLLKSMLVRPTVVKWAALAVGALSVAFWEDILMFVVQTSLGSRIPALTRLYRGGELALTETGRSNIWRDSGTIFADSPLLGHGLNSTRTVLKDYYDVGLTDTVLGHAHNSYVELLLDVGLIGVSVIAVAFAALIVRLLILNESAALLAAGVVTGFALGMTESFIFGLAAASAILWWWTSFAVFALPFKHPHGDAVQRRNTVHPRYHGPFENQQVDAAVTK